VRNFISGETDSGQALLLSFPRRSSRVPALNGRLGDCVNCLTTSAIFVAIWFDGHAPERFSPALSD
jgi:hypothetical protein